MVNRVKKEKNSMKKLWVSIAAALALMLAGCGKSGVNVDNAPYQPKIVVEGYLYCGETVSNIRLMRNFPIGAQVDTNRLNLTPLGNDVKASINGVALSFDPATQTYYASQISINYGETYTLDVSASVGGSQLHTTSTTTTPPERLLTSQQGSRWFSVRQPVYCGSVHAVSRDGLLCLLHRA